MSDWAYIISVLPHPLILIDADEKIAALNSAAEEIVIKDAVGRRYISVLRQPSLIDAIESARREEQAVETRYLTYTDGQDEAYDVICSPVIFAPGRVGVLVSFDDVTEVEQASQMRRDFIANVSHELRTPLTALLGFVETLRGAAKDDPVARDRFLSIMEKEAERMNRLVGDLLSLSRVEREERQRPTDLINIVGIIQSVIQILNPVVTEAGIQINLDAEEAQIDIPGDEDQIQQVLVNLTENAVKYGGMGGDVTIRVVRVESDDILRMPAVQIDIRDQGDGIAPEHIARLTERFYRVDSHRSRELGGTGLGLAIVKHILNRHRGRLRIASEVGIGSTFTVILPQADGSPAEN